MVSHKMSALYWSKLQDKLLRSISMFKIEQEITQEKRETLQTEVNTFCEQGTGFQYTLYKFISYQLEVFIVNADKKKYDAFVEYIHSLCGYLDENYLNKHPKYKKSIHSIKELSEFYWISFK